MAKTKRVATPNWQMNLNKRAKGAVDKLTVLKENGSGLERANVPFRPYTDTHLALKQLAIDLEEKRGEIVKVHDLMIEAVNDLFKKYGREHVAARPTRAKK